MTIPHRVPVYHDLVNSRLHVNCDTVSTADRLRCCSRLLGWLLRSSDDKLAHGDAVFWSINVVDVTKAKQFFASLFGWTYSDPGPTGAVRIEGMLGSMHPSEIRDPAAIWLRTDDMPAIVDRVRRAGGQATEIIDTAQGITSTILDPWGVKLALSWGPHEAPPVVASQRHGELAGWSVESTSARQSAEVLGELFGWSMTCANLDSYLIDGTPLPGNITQANTPSEPTLCFAVDGPTPTQLIEELGGQVLHAEPYKGGSLITARDNQGYRFSLAQAI